MFELERVRKKGLPPVSAALGAITIALFLLEQALGGTSSVLRLGASYQPLVWREHELWRLLCPAFLHAGIVHLAMNAYAFYQLAPFVERVWGSGRLLIVYVVSAIGSFALSSRMNAAPAVGASGAIFGLMGFLVAASYMGTQWHEVRTITRGTWGQSLLVWAAITLYAGTAAGGLGIANIDNYAHLGGLLTGIGLGLVVTETDELTAPGLVLAIASGLAIVVAFGFAFASPWLAERRRADEGGRIGQARAAFLAKDWEKTVDLCERALREQPDAPVATALLDLEALALEGQGDARGAARILERSMSFSPSARTARELATVALERSDAKTAVYWIQEARRFGDAAREEAAIAAVESAARARLGK
jgi:rhomboid protease GluP